MIPDLRWRGVTRPYLYKMCCYCCLKAAVSRYTIGAGGGTRTHKTVRSADFGSAVYPYSTTPAYSHHRVQLSETPWWPYRYLCREILLRRVRTALYNSREVYINPITNAGVLTGYRNCCPIGNRIRYHRSPQAEVIPLALEFSICVECQLNPRGHVFWRYHKDTTLSTSILTGALRAHNVWSIIHHQGNNLYKIF